MPVAQSTESPELVCLCALREARSAFFRQIVNHAQKHIEDHPEDKLSREDIDLLRSDNAYQIAEFYYLVGELNLSDRQRIRMFLNRHNADMEELVENKSRRDLMGLLKQRVQEAIFAPPQIEKIVEYIADGRLRLDQSDLGKLLAQLISPETCRKTVVALAKGGLLTRINIGRVLIVSNGDLEKYFKDHLSHIVGTVKEHVP